MRQEIEYHQQDTAKGKLAGLILILLFLIVGVASSQNSVITEDFSDYKPGPQMTTPNSSFSPSTTTSHQPAPPNLICRPGSPQTECNASKRGKNRTKPNRSDSLESDYRHFGNSNFSKNHKRNQWNHVRLSLKPSFQSL